MSRENKRRRTSGDTYQAIQDEPNQVSTTDSSKITPQEQTRSLFVRSLPASVTSERLAEHFSQSFAIKHATVVIDPQTKISKGFGFVTFVDAEDAHAAIEQFNNAILDGRKIKVEQAQARQREEGQDGVAGTQNTKAAELKAKREAQKQEVQPPRLIVRNLPWSIKTSDDLAALFRSYGKVKQAIVPNRGPNIQAGFGIVLMRGRQNAEKAIAGVNGKEIDGRVIAVDWAVDKQTWTEMQKSETENPKNVEGKNIAQPPSTGAHGQDTEPVADNDDMSDPKGNPEDEDGGEVETSSDLDIDTGSHDGIDDDDSTASTPLQSDIEDPASTNTQNDTTVFIRNLPFTVEDDDLKSHFQPFGPVRYARVVYDPETERPRGTGFVCFFNEADAKSCVKDAPKAGQPLESGEKAKFGRHNQLGHSLLQDQSADPTGRYTLDGRVLIVTRALSKSQADQKASESKAKRDAKEGDRRRLFLLSEGTISKSSKLYEQLGKAEIDIRQSSARQRQKLIKENPNLGLSLTRLSVRNVPRSIGSKELKALAREAVVGFATDVKSGLRQPLSKEELGRGGEEMKEAERKRKEKGVGIVKQAKIVFESKEGGKVKESGGGRSRGYGFVEYTSHRNALAGLRWLNGHLVKPPAASSGDAGAENGRGKRLIVEFAIENAQVVQRRTERERKFNGRDATKPQSDKSRPVSNSTGTDTPRNNSQKRKRTADTETKQDSKPNTKKTSQPAVPVIDQAEKDKIAKRNRIIAKKRRARQVRKS